MKTWHKIMVAPAAAIAFLACIGAIAFLMLKQQNDALEGMVTQRMARFEVAASAARDMGQVHSRVYRLMTWLSNYDEAKIRSSTADLRKDIDKVAAALARMAAGELAAEERRLLEAVQPLVAKYRSGVEKSIDLGTTDVAYGLMSMQTADRQFEAMVQQLDSLVALEEKLAHEKYEGAAAGYRQTLLLLAALLAGAIACATVIAWKMSHTIVRPLQTAMAAADCIARGDLTVRVRAEGTDESAQLLGAVAAMSEGLHKLVTEVSQGARIVADTSTQIAQGNLDLSQRTEEQAGTLEETASSMEELTSSVTQNAHNARQASDLAVGAAEVARKGGEVIGEVISTMGGIAESSRRISDIIGVIDGIAFQTNILALNAAVEAARAGEQGRGFAVVASEVRQLAQRSAEAARQIKGLIGDSVGKVETGSRLVQTAGTTMQEIVSSVTSVSKLIAEIAAASQEQSSGIEQVNTAVGQMDHVVQQNASLVEEATAATEAMKEQAETLMAAVSRFRLAGDGAPAATSARIEAWTPAPIQVRPAQATPHARAPQAAMLPKPQAGGAAAGWAGA